MNTKVSILEKKIEVLNEQVQSIRKERWESEEKFQANLTEHFKKYFRGVVSEDITVACTSLGIYFYKRREGDSYDKEIFSVYLRQSYTRSEAAYTEAELSYYTTSSNSDFELERLENLGRVAMLIRNFKDQVVAAANAIAEAYRAEIEQKEFYKRESEVEAQISALRKEITELKKEASKKALFSEEGLSLKDLHVQMKFNYTPRISKLKLIDVSKSGKKATAVFTFSHSEHTSREENVSVEKIIEQVI